MGSLLTLTDTAAQALRTITERTPELTNDSGLRIRARELDDDQVGFELELTEAPNEDDEVVEGDGARVFLEPEVATELEDKVLDARIIEGRLQFSLAEQD